MDAEVLIKIVPSKTLSEGDIRDLLRFAKAEAITPQDFIAQAIQDALQRKKEAAAS